MIDHVIAVACLALPRQVDARSTSAAGAVTSNRQTRGAMKDDFRDHSVHHGDIRLIFTCLSTATHWPKKDHRLPLSHGFAVRIPQPASLGSAACSAILFARCFVFGSCYGHWAPVWPQTNAETNKRRSTMPQIDKDIYIYTYTSLSLFL